MKVVLDTNVYISAFLFKGLPFTVFEMSVEQFELFTSRFINEEVLEKFSLKFKLDEDLLTRYRQILAEIRLVEPENPVPQVCHDPEDNFILQLAASVKADYLVTGDKDLLLLESFNSTKIVTPAQFLERVTA